MLLTTADQFGHARRNAASVLVYSIWEDGTKELNGFGMFFGFDAETVTILSPRLGLMHYPRDKVHVQLVRLSKPSDQRDGADPDREA